MSVDLTAALTEYLRRQAAAMLTAMLEVHVPPEERRR